jgi:hypothetical protein
MSDYDALLVEAAAKYNVPIEELRAIFKKETRSGRVNRTSPAGAQGLMQLMPGTARDMGVTNVNDPRQNIFGGAKYYAQQRTRFKDPALAAAAYNAGPNAVAKAGGVPNFRETRDYVADFLNMIQRKAPPPAPTPPFAAAPTGPSMDETDDTDTDLAVMPGAPSWVQTYMSRSADLAKRRGTSRAEQLKANTAMLEKAYAGPSRSQQLFALSQAFLQPTRTGGGRFAQVMNNVVGALGGTNQQMQEAQQKRAMAALQLNNTYANEGFEGEEEGLKRDLALQTLLQKGQKLPSVIMDSGRAYEPSTGTLVTPPGDAAWQALAAEPTVENYNNFVKQFGPRFADKAAQIVRSGQR